MFLSAKQHCGYPAYIEETEVAAIEKNCDNPAPEYYAILKSGKSYRIRESIVYKLIQDRGIYSPEGDK